MLKDYRIRAAIILLAATLIGGSALLVSWLRSPEYAGATIGGPFSLIDQTGKRVTEQDFREFTFTNAALLHTRNNRDFFKGTVVEKAVADELGFTKTPVAA